MVESEQRTRSPIGTVAYDNWRAYKDGAPQLGAFEFQLYTDARLTGEVTTGLGPYAFINLVPMLEGRGEVRAAFVLQFSAHISYDIGSINRTDASRYHGGSLTDEIAALASLKCGVRLRSVGPSRRFDANGDPKGRPVAWSTAPAPSLEIRERGLVLPTVTGEHSIMPVEELSSFPSLTPEQAIAL